LGTCARFDNIQNAEVIKPMKKRRARRLLNVGRNEVTLRRAPSLEEQDAEWETNLVMDCEPANRKFEQAIARLQVAFQNRSPLGRRKRSECEAWANLIEVTLALPFEE
jgi:hypothetical protein